MSKFPNYVASNFIVQSTGALLIVFVDKEFTQSWESLMSTEMFSIQVNVYETFSRMTFKFTNHDSDYILEWPVILQVKSPYHLGICWQDRNSKKLSPVGTTYLIDSELNN